MASSPKFYDRVLMSSATTGTGPMTLGSAIAGYQAWSVLGNGNSAYYYIEAVDGSGIPTGQWEVGIGTYTSSGTTLSRDSLLSSSTGSPVSFATATRIALIAQPAAVATTPIGDMGGRLTLTTGVPVTTADVTSTDLFYTPYLHNRVELWNGSGWVRYTFTEITKALGTLTSALPYDVYLFDNAGTLELNLTAWTNVTTRATAIVQQDGVWCKTGDLGKRLVGTILTSSTTQTQDAAIFRGVSNVDNAVFRPLWVCPGYANDNTGTTYTTTSSTWAAATGGTMSYMFSVPRGIVITLSAASGGSTTTQPAAGIGDNSTTQAAALVLGPAETAYQTTSSVSYSTIKAAGAFNLSLLIATVINGQTATFAADFGRLGGSAADEPATTLMANLVN